MLEKMFKLLDNVRKDIIKIEEEVFKDPSESLIKDIMIKKRNMVMLKHICKPQISVLSVLENKINDIFNGIMEVYFEDLQDKIEQVTMDVEIIEENVESIENAFKSMVDMRTNFTIKILTIFSAFMLPLTLITSFY